MPDRNPTVHYTVPGMYVPYVQTVDMSLLYTVCSPRWQPQLSKGTWKKDVQQDRTRCSGMMSGLILRQLCTCRKVPSGDYRYT